MIKTARVLAISERSSRWCNFSKDKFGNELTFCRPYWADNDIFDVLEAGWKTCEDYYLDLITCGCKPEQAREVLPLGLASPIVYTAFEDEWKLVIKKRTGPDAHPDAKKVCELISSCLEKDNSQSVQK